MTSHDDDEVIDFKKLEKELHNAVEADAKYWRENDAKFRAVGQKVATYDEFQSVYFCYLPVLFFVYNVWNFYIWHFRCTNVENY